ncbi:PepSY domain-containing protein [Azospirillum sp. BE72]|uniref:PepSY domain-containing protein n=1 Tax=Azospirillum sp. BE72 TaxID=2817776 RepID=UPI002861AEB6|nr:PepSY domain-containing protein [Azospirillum sp. BE72]MDR6773754.1 putative membrane protein YkoI [Azospirillum sp. BE72]
MLHVRLTAAALCGVLFLSSPASADERDHERAREAVALGRILPLEAIVERVRAEVSGDILDVELEDEHDGRLVYEIKVLAPGGRILKLEYDAATGDLLRSKGRRR